MPTSERDALIRHIIDEPDDDAPRLVFADWLDEHGEPERAEFIRLQCRIAADEDAPPEQRRAWRVREANLLTAHGQRWLGPLAEFTDERGFQRGMLHRLRIRAADMVRRADELFTGEVPRTLVLSDVTGTAWRQLFECPALARFAGLELSFAVRDTPRMDDLARCPHLGELRELSLRNAGVGDAEFRALARMHHLRLRSLKLEQYAGGGRRPTPEALAFFANSLLAVGLHELDLTNRIPGDAGLVSLATARHGQLRSLSLASNEIADDGMRALATASWSAGLRSLDLSWNRIGPEGVRYLADAPLPNLRQLRLESNPIGDGGLVSLTAATLPSIAELYLGKADLDNRDLVGLSRAEWLSRLRVFELGNNMFSRQAFAEFLGSAPFGGLRQLTLSNALLDADNVRTLTANPALAGLRSLSLLDSPIGDEGLRYLLQDGVLPRLNELQLNGCAITDEGLADLAASPRLGRLRSLFLGEPIEGSAGLIALASSPGLAAVEVFGFQAEYNEAGWRALLDSPYLSRETLLFFFRDLPEGLKDAFCRRQRFASLVLA